LHRWLHFQTFGKLTAPYIVAADAQSALTCCGLFTVSASFPDITPSETSFLVDTGSSLSVLPRQFFPHATQSATRFTAANGSAVLTFGKQPFVFHITPLNESFNWHFTIASVTQPILGADFLDHHDLLVDCRHKKLLRRNQTVIATDQCPLITDDSTYQKTERIANTQSLILTKDLASKDSLPYVTEHIIATTPCAPIKMRRRELSQQRREAAEKEFSNLLESGIVRRSSSPWAAPLQIITKKDGSLRICGDYRGLNRVTVPDSYPMPLISDILRRFHDCTIFSSIDLAKAYHQIPVHPESIQKTAVTTPFGLFEYCKMPFGLRNASQTFQRHIDTVLQGLNNAVAYIDDIIIASRNADEHRTHLSDVIDRLKTHQLQINPEKCQFSKPSVQFLGHIISADGIKPIDSRLKTIKEFPKPQTVTAMRSFLGMLNFCRKFIPNLSALTAPLSTLATGPKKQAIKWSNQADHAFESIRNTLSSITSLHFPDPTLPLTLTTDASNIAVGAVLMQIRENKPEPLEFFSTTLSTPQTRYSTFDRELLAIFLSIKHFEHMLIGRQFLIFTDHKPIVHALTMKNPFPRQERQISYLSQFNMEIQFIRGAENVIADCLSRVQICSIDIDPLFTPEILRDNPPQERDLSRFSTRPFLRDKIFYDLSYPGCPRPILAEELRNQAFKAIHDSAHPGSTATYNLLRTKVIWPFMRRDIKLWCKSCFLCQSSKVTRHTKPPLLTFPTGSRFHTIHMDLVGPLPPSEGYTYLLTIVDRNSRWPEAFPLRNINAETIVRIFVDNWISRFGVPKRIITDQGRQFESKIFQDLVQTLGSQRLRTTAFHPQSNGIVERFHKTLKNSLRATSITRQWTKQLPFILLGWRNIPSSRHGCSPAQMLFGTNTTLINDLVFNNSPTSDVHLELARKHFAHLDTTPSNNQSWNIFIPPSLFDSKFVWLKTEHPTSLQMRYSGPHRVISFNQTSNTASIEFQGKSRTINVEKLKPAPHLMDDDIQETLSQILPKRVTFSTWASQSDSDTLTLTKLH